MFYENELRFLCNTFKKSNIPTRIAAFDTSISDLTDESLRLILGELQQIEITIREIIEKYEKNVIVKLKDSLDLCYIIFPLPDMESEEVLLIGPYLSKPIETKQLLLIGERYGISPQKKKLLQGYYERVSVLEENSHLFVMLNAFCECVFGVDEFFIIDLNREFFSGTAAFAQSRPDEDAEGVLLNMEIMEKRYTFENEMMRAVSLGQPHRATRILEVLTELSFEKRLADSLRNCKNYCIIMNTLLRKAAENGGVHPLYINDMSSDYAVKIEQLAKTEDVSELMYDMFHSYCRLVRKHSMKKYSATVQRVIAIIDSDLSANLSLSSLAKTLNITPGYLSTIFKKETKKNLTEYIIGERIQLAQYLIGTTRLQIQTIALHCGIMDVQYFSKVFKRYVGKTPKEYRESLK